MSWVGLRFGELLGSFRTGPQSDYWLIVVDGRMVGSAIRQTGSFQLNWFEGFGAELERVPADLNDPHSLVIWLARALQIAESRVRVTVTSA